MKSVIGITILIVGLVIFLILTVNSINGVREIGPNQYKELAEISRADPEIKKQVEDLINKKGYVMGDQLGYFKRVHETKLKRDQIDTILDMKTSR